MHADDGDGALRACVWAMADGRCVLVGARLPNPGRLYKPIVTHAPCTGVHGSTDAVATGTIVLHHTRSRNDTINTHTLAHSLLDTPPQTRRDELHGARLASPPSRYVDHRHPEAHRHPHTAHPPPRPMAHRPLANPTRHPLSHRRRSWRPACPPRRPTAPPPGAPPLGPRPRRPSTRPPTPPRTLPAVPSHSASRPERKRQPMPSTPPSR